MESENVKPPEQLAAPPPTADLQAADSPEAAPADDAQPKHKAKKKKLTKEERKARRLEKKRLKLLRIENNKKKFYYDTLERELKFTKKSYERGTDDWEHYCLDVEYPNAKLELKTAIQSLDRMLDVKDHTINRLKADRKTADDQYRRNAEKHADIITYLIKLFELFVSVLKANYDDIAYEMIKDFHIEMRNKERVFTRCKIYYENLLFATNLLSITFLENKKREFIMRKEEKNEHKFMVIDAINHNMAALQAQMLTIMREMKMSSVTPDRLKTYERLLKKKQLAEVQFKTMNIDTKKKEKIINRLQVELAALELACSKNISDLKYEKQIFKANFEILKSKYDNDMIIDQSHLRVLAASTFNPIKKLEQLERFGQKLIGLSAVARKYETEKEKILPFAFHNFDDESENGEKSNETMENMQLLQWFMYKVSRASYTNRQLIDERDTLAKENECLRECLRRYCHQQTYNAIIASLRFDNNPTSVIPTQEASQMMTIINYIKKP